MFNQHAPSHYHNGSRSGPLLSNGSRLLSNAIPSPKPTLISHAFSNLDHPLRCPRTSSFVSPEDSGSPSPVSGAWNPLLQQEFREDFCKFLIAARLAQNTANNPLVCLFIDKWIPSAIVPDHRTLSGPILDREAGKVEEKLKLKLKGRKATLQTDGSKDWRNPFAACCR
jgi:hypothetical protein